MSSGQPATLWIRPERLLYIFRKIKNQPNKIFRNSDFLLNPQSHKHYLNTLVKLGVVEEININRSKAKGYKLKRVKRK